MPLRSGLLVVHNALRGAGLRDQVCVVASAKVVTGFDIFRNIALGADVCNSARAMMFALGCIQARRCNDNSCPVGVATQDPARAVGVAPKHKAPRVARYHAATIKSFCELLAAAGLESPNEIRLHHLSRRVDAVTVESLDQIYTHLPTGCLLDPKAVPESWRADWEAAAVNRFGC